MARSVNGWTVISSSQLNRSPFPATKIVPIPGILKGDVAIILHYVGSQFNKKVEKLYNPGCWGYAYKKLGSISWSNHASGTAIDLNAPSHPWKKKGTFNTKQRSEIRKILSYLEGAVAWGGDWSIAYVDEMHFEIKGSSAKIKKIANKIKNPMADIKRSFIDSYFTVMARKPSNAIVNTFLKNPEKRVYTYVQKKFMYPNWVKKSAYNKLVGTVSQRNEEKRTLSSKISTFSGQIKNLQKEFKDFKKKSDDQIDEQAGKIVALDEKLKRCEANSGNELDTELPEWGIIWGFIKEKVTQSKWWNKLNEKIGGGK